MSNSLKPIRIATEEDAPRILEIYTPFIQFTPITFETEIPSPGDFLKRITSSIHRYPWFVYEENGKVLGYAYGSEHRSRSAYRWSCDASVYVDLDHARKGIGRALYETLFRCLKAQGYANVFAGITDPNEASTRLHEQFGFKKVGTYQKVGFKLGKWHDVSWYQLILQTPEPPGEPIPFEQMKDRI